MEKTQLPEQPHRHVHCCATRMVRFSLHGARCGVLVASRARHVGPLEISVMEHHLLTCRPLDTIDDHEALLKRFRITAVEEPAAGHAPP